MIIRSKDLGATMVALALWALGCTAENARGTGASADSAAVAVSAAAAPADTGLVKGTPAGGLEQWIGEVRAGVDSLPALAAKDASAAKNQALNLYVSRQEYIEIYYGTAGRSVKDAALASAVTTAEERFHELLRTVNTADGRIDMGSLRAAAAALSSQYDAVLERARALKVDLSRPVVSGGGA